jgi:uncharacterized protein (TIGR02597 family)
MHHFMNSASRPLSFATALALSAAALCLPAAAQNTATTDPVGFITLNISGATATGGAAFSFRSLGLTRPVEYQGNAEQVAAATLTDNEATWTANQFSPAGATVATATHYLEIVRPPNSQTAVPGEGSTYDIVGTDAGTKTITLGQNLAPGVASGALFKIRKHWTIGAVFGQNNEAGLTGGTPDNADRLLVYNSSTNGYDTYFYQLGGSGTGWRSTADLNTDVSGKVLYPDEGIVLKRSAASNVAVVLTGAVKTGATSIPVLPGTNVVANVFGAPMTLASSNLYTGNSATGLNPGNLSTADQVLIYNGTGYDIYYFATPSPLDPAGGWRNAAVPGQPTDPATVSIPVGTSVIVKRQGSTGFDWKAPQHPASL